MKKIIFFNINYILLFVIMQNVHTESDKIDAAKTITQRVQFIEDITGVREQEFRKAMKWTYGTRLFIPQAERKAFILGKEESSGKYTALNPNLRRAAIFQGTWIKIENNTIKPKNELPWEQKSWKKTSGAQFEPYDTGVSLGSLDNYIKGQLGYQPVTQEEPYFNIIVYNPGKDHEADLRWLANQPTLKNTVFQIASNFNALEGGMGYDIRHNEIKLLEGMSSAQAQGEAASIVTAGATIYRKYFMPQINLMGKLEKPYSDNNRNFDLMVKESGFAQPAPKALDAIMNNGIKKAFGEESIVQYISVGIHKDIVPSNGYSILPGDRKARPKSSLATEPFYVDTTTYTVDPNKSQLVSYIFTSALDFSNRKKKETDKQNTNLKKFATTVLAASYYGTLLGAWAIEQPRVVLTMMGAGAFENEVSWINDVMIEPISKDEEQSLFHYFMDNGGLQVTIIYRPDPGRRNAKDDIQFLEKLYAFADDVNKSKFNLEQAKNVITPYVNALYTQDDANASKHAETLQSLLPSQLLALAYKSDEKPEKPSEPDITPVEPKKPDEKPVTPPTKPSDEPPPSPQKQPLEKELQNLTDKLKALTNVLK